MVSYFLYSTFRRDFLETKDRTNENNHTVRQDFFHYEVARQLKEARKAQNITQEVLAERIGTKKSNISRLESGRYNPSLDFLIRVAEGLGRRVQITIQ